jgi:hypothetical protein
MTIQALRALLEARPFQPFDICLADGTSIGVEHPELVGQSASGRTIGVGTPNDAIQIIDLLLVTSLKPRRGRPRRH